MNVQDWQDVEPIEYVEEDDAVAKIMYTEEYSQANSYLRAALAVNEHSQRALALTEVILRMNPSHYTVWAYRADIVLSLESSLEEELHFLARFAEDNSKNFQIWNHRQKIIDRYNDATGEIDFLNQILALDAKNYHVWTYRHWVVRRFGLYNDQLDYADSLIEIDVRNNSAWCYRNFIVFHCSEITESVVEREARYCVSKIRLAPSNACPWNYLRWIFRKHNSAKPILVEIVNEYGDLTSEEQSKHALDAAADLYFKEDPTRARESLEKLKETDKLRKTFYDYRIEVLAL